MAILHRKPFVIDNFDALGNPVPIRCFRDIWHTFFNAFVVDTELGLAFVHAALDGPICLFAAGLDVDVEEVCGRTKYMLVCESLVFHSVKSVVTRLVWPTHATTWRVREQITLVLASRCMLLV